MDRQLQKTIALGLVIFLLGCQNSFKAATSSSSSGTQGTSALSDSAQSGASVNSGAMSGTQGAVATGGGSNTTGNAGSAGSGSQILPNGGTSPRIYFKAGELKLSKGERVGNNHLSLVMQSDGNLVLYRDSRAVWSSQTLGKCTACVAVYESSGNLVIYDNTNAIWTQAWAGSSGLMISDETPYIFPLFISAAPLSNGFSINAKATDKSGKAVSSIGFNEEFILGYGLNQGWPCPLWGGTSISQCDNYPSIPLRSVRGYLDALLDKGIRVHREIVPIKYYSDPANLQNIIAVMKEFQDRHMTLIFANGFPIPGPTVQNGLMCIPADDHEFEYHTAYDISLYTADLFRNLKASGQLDNTWLTNNVIIEPFNEFDAVPGLNPDGSCDMTTKYGSPKKAALFHSVITYVFWFYGLENEITTPSFVNAFGGALSESPSSIPDKFRVYLKDYYSSGGSGRPNIHLYYAYYGSEPTFTSVADYVGNLASSLASAAQGTPSQYQKRILVGEAGVPYQGAGCSSGGVPENMTNVRNGIYSGLVQNSTVNSSAEMLLFWRLAYQNEVPADGKPLGCGAYYGTVSPTSLVNGFNSWDDFDSVGKSIFSAIWTRWNQ